MTTINTDFSSLNPASWQLTAADKKSGAGSANATSALPDLQSLIDSLSDPAQAGSFISRSLQGHAEFSLKAAFQGENGQQVNIDLNLTIDFKFEQATKAYRKQAPDPAAADDFSPEATAKRITDFAMGFLGAFQGNHASDDKNTQANGFFDLAKTAIGKGFDQAKQALGSLYGDQASQTYDLVMKFLDDAKAKLLGAVDQVTVPQVTAQDSTAASAAKI